MTCNLKIRFPAKDGYNINGVCGGRIETKATIRDIAGDERQIQQCNECKNVEIV